VERRRQYRGDANPECLRVTQRRPVAQEAIGIRPQSAVPVEHVARWSTQRDRRSLTYQQIINSWSRG
jgi:hypothetical protein